MFFSEISTFSPTSRHHKRSMARQDVFLRELVSNAADACDKKRFLALTNSDAPPEPMKLRINTDKAQRMEQMEDVGEVMLSYCEVYWFTYCDDVMFIVIFIVKFFFTKYSDGIL